MFQSLLPNQTLYVLNKSGVPVLDKAIVQNTSPIKTIPAQQFGAMPSQMVDVAVLINGRNETYSLPAMGIVGTLQGNNSIVVSMNREAMSNELMNVRQKSVDHINANEFHQNVIAKCDELWQGLNPEAREKEQQKNEINQLKEQMNTMAQMMTQLVAQNQQLLSQRESGGTSRSSKNKEKCEE